ncbi:hypothetical protein DFH08DRAFT_938285 [Mycena albidolilacea]|uniref:Uncharacterized protein n=1 Tax=Mycena albidolilacea TaxID=1033008 RepID=A0AAD6ZXG8_9AGAR|nr:hypothetical protein DFH08DRAFT_938285 [Mycena albidolilacea]
MDEIGLVQAIAVKEHSSSKRKTPFTRIQLRHQADPDAIAKQKIIDMKVQWSSMYAKLDHAHNLKGSVNDFAFEIAMDEVGKKHPKLAKLQLSEAEWKCVDVFLNLLAVAEQAQHRFSSDLKSMLHLALPALESLHTGWTQLAADPQYTHFTPAIEEALEKVDEYYQKTSNSDAYTFAMGYFFAD